MYFESHAHYDDKRYNEDRGELLKNLPAQGVDYAINIGTTVKNSHTCVDLAEKYSYIYATVGVHPHYANTLDNAGLEALKTLASHEKVVAIGEIGLDFHYDYSPRDVQREWFSKQLELAKETSLPVVIHSRDAALETFNMLKDSGVCKGVVHCYSGSFEMAAEYVKMGFLIGITGVVTYKNAVNIVEVAEKIPLEKILIETDCPYLSPEPNRGKRNDSSNLKYIAEKIAQLKGVSAEEVAKTTQNNAIKLFLSK